MKLLKRYLLQVILWLAIWGLLFGISNFDVNFIITNTPAFILQVIILFGLIYTLVPKLLFKKKYILFFLTTIPIIVLGAYIATELGPDPFAPTNRPHPPKMHREPNNLPSRFFIHLLIITISSITAVFLETFIYAQQKENAITLTKAELMESELKWLKMQINPHFLFNALNNIYALSVTNSEKTQESISTLSDMLRYALYEGEQHQVLLKKEVDYIHNYIKLFRLKSSSYFDITFKEKVDKPSLKVAPMLFIPYIENAFKHSGIEKGKNHYIRIELIQKNNSIEFTVENSLPTTKIVKDKQGGIGLKNVKKRLEILYPNSHELTITNTNNYKVYLKLIIR